MKQLFYAVIFLTVGCFYNLAAVSTAYSLTISENFNGYSVGVSLIGNPDGTDTGWAGPWNTSDETPAAYTCQEGPVGWFTPYMTGITNTVYRDFQQTIAPTTNQTTGFTLNMTRAGTQEPFYCVMDLKNSSGTTGISFGVKGYGSPQFGYFTNAAHTAFVNLEAVSMTTSYAISIDHIDFSANTYRLTIGSNSYADKPFVDGAVDDFSRVAFVGQSVGRITTLDNIQINGNAVPEPSSIAFFAIGILGLISKLRSRIK